MIEVIFTHSEIKLNNDKIIINFYCIAISSFLNLFTVNSPIGPYALLVINSIFSLRDNSSYTGPAGAVSSMLTCPAVVGEYTSFLRIHKCVIKVPMSIPKTTDRKELMTTMIEILALVEREATLKVGVTVY